VPYHTHVNDLSFFETTPRRSIADYVATLQLEFTTLCTAGATRRRMMSMRPHDFVAGRPAYTPVVERLIRWMQGHPGVWFARRDEVAEWALGEGKALTPHDIEYMPTEPM
jgi:hypothetical protein